MLAKKREDLTFNKDLYIVKRLKLLKFKKTILTTTLKLQKTLKAKKSGFNYLL